MHHLNPHSQQHRFVFLLLLVLKFKHTEDSPKQQSETSYFVETLKISKSVLAKVEINLNQQKVLRGIEIGLRSTLRSEGFSDVTLLVFMEFDFSAVYLFWMTS